MIRFAMRLAALAGAIASAAGSFSADYYVGDTGRTAKMDVPAMAPAGGAMPGADASTSGSESSESGAVFQVDPKDLYFPDVEKAITQSGVDRIAVQSDGIATSLRTFAEIQINAITGRGSVNGQDPVYTVLGMIYQNTLWVRAPIIPV